MNISSRTVLKVLGLTTLFIGLVLFAFMVRRELVWVGSAFFFAVALNPAVAQLTRVIPGRSRSLAVTAVFVLAGLFFVLLLTMLIPPLVRQSGQFVRDFPQYTNQIVNGNSIVSQQVRDLNLVGRVRQSQSQLFGYISSAGGSFFTILTGAFSSLAVGVTVLVLTFFMLIEGPGWISAFWSVVPAKRRSRLRPMTDEMYRAVTGYVTGNVLTSILVAAATAVMLAVVGVPYAIPLGIVVGLFDFLPLVGATIGAVIVIIAALFSSVGAAIAMIIFFGIYQQIENHVLQPLVYGRTVAMSPLFVLVSVLVGAGVGGILGALVAIPVGASLQIVVRDLAARQAAVVRKKAGV
jgi:predicted PurR-regulated permease PerM